MSELFYVQDKRQYVGNSVLWWAHEGNGYTTDISQAGQYTHKPTDRDTDVLWPVDMVDSVVKGHVDIQDLMKARDALDHADDEG